MAANITITLKRHPDTVIHKVMDIIHKTDKAGVPFEISICKADDVFLLLDMYCIFTPKPASQGLPPLDHQTCCDWVKRLFETGRNYLAWKNGSVIGHAALVPDLDGKAAEFIIFIDQNYRNLGIGTELTKVAIEEARDLGLRSVWLTVETSNYIAIKLYGNFGFQFCDMDPYERTMLLLFQ